MLAHSSMERLEISPRRRKASVVVCDLHVIAAAVEAGAPHL